MNKITDFQHDIKTPVSTILIAVDCIKPIIEGLKQAPSGSADTLTLKQIDGILKLLRNVNSAALKINTLTDALK